MKLFAALPLLSVLLVPDPSSAADLTFGGTIGITSNYLSDGLSETGNRPALQFSAEIGKNGFYVNLFGSQVRDENDNRASLDLSAGYRAELASFGYDVGITQSFRNSTGADGTELYGSVSYPVSDRLTLTAEASFDLVEKTFGGNLGAEYVLADAWTLSAVAGQADPVSSPFWGASLAYDINEATSLVLDYQDTSSTPEVIALTLTYKFGKGGE